MTDEASREDATPQRTALQAWWDDLQTRDRAARARLRGADLDAAMIDAATLRLLSRFGRRSPDDLARVAAVAMVLATVREDNRSASFARQIGFKKFPTNPDSPTDDEKPALSPLRFKSLMAAETDAEIARQFARAVAIVGGAAHVNNLAWTVFKWRDEATRRNFVFDYYAAADAAPPPATASTETAADVREAPASA